MRRLRDGWNAFWFTPAGPLNLGLCRLLFFGFFFLFYLPRDFSAWGGVSKVFWMPLWYFRILRLPLLSVPVIGCIQWIWKAALLLSCAGWLTRPATAVSLLLGTYLLGLPNCFGKTHHYDAMVLLIMGILASSRCGDGGSLDSWIRSQRNRRNGRPVLDPVPSGDYRWPVQAARVVMSFVFFGAGFSKIRHSGLRWICSSNMAVLLIQGRYHISNADPATTWGLTLARFPWIYRGIAAATLFFELGYPLALFIPAARWIFIPGVLGMLVMIRLLMGPTFYPFILCQLFWIPWDRLLGRLAGRTNG